MRNTNLYYDYIKDNVIEFETFLFNKLRIENIKNLDVEKDIPVDNIYIRNSYIEVINHVKNIMSNVEFSKEYNIWLQETIKTFTKKFLNDMSLVKQVEDLYKYEKSNVTEKLTKNTKQLNKTNRNNISVALEGVFTINRDWITSLHIDKLKTYEEISNYIRQIEVFLLLYNIITFISLIVCNIKITVKFIPENITNNVVKLITNLKKDIHESTWLEAYNLLFYMLSGCITV